MAQGPVPVNFLLTGRPREIGAGPIRDQGRHKTFSRQGVAYGIHIEN